MKTRLALFGLLAVAATACSPIFYWDLVVEWNIDGSTSLALCSTYNINEFEIEASGPEFRRRTIPCSSHWNTNTRFYDLEEGHYKVTVKALEKGSSKVLAQRTATALVRDDQVLYEPDRALITFRASDFTGGSGQARINFYWNINNTVDGTAKGKSWDTCAEVGASKAVMIVQKLTSSGANSGAPKSVSADCHAGGNMSAAVNVDPGDYKVAVKLVDAAGADLTTTTPIDSAEAKLTGITDKQPGEFVTDFYWYAFKQGKNNSITGTYLFNLTLGDSQQSCASVSPLVKGISLKLERLESVTAGSYKLVTTNVCAAGGACFKSNGSATGVCQSSNLKYDIKGATWGLYRGTLNALASGNEICWKKTSFGDSDVTNYTSHLLVGAGTVNPVRKINIPKDKTNTSAACKP